MGDELDPIRKIIEARVRDLGLNPTEASRRATGQPDIYRKFVENGARLRADRLASLCKTLGLEFYVGPPRDSLPVPEPIEIDATDYDHLPLFGSVDAAAGEGAEPIDETATGSVAFRSDWLKAKRLSPKSSVIIQVRGDSMAPTIRDGSLILVDTRAKTVRNRGIYVVRHDGGLYVKRVIRQKTGIMMTSDNTEFEPFFVSQADLAHNAIVGRAVWSGGDIK